MQHRQSTLGIRRGLYARTLFLAECRLAMVALVGFVFQHGAYPGTGPVANLIAHVKDPFHVTCATISSLHTLSTPFCAFACERMARGGATLYMLPHSEATPRHAAAEAAAAAAMVKFGDGL